MGSGGKKKGKDGRQKEKVQNSASAPFLACFRIIPLSISSPFHCVVLTWSVAPTSVGTLTAGEISLVNVWGVEAVGGIGDIGVLSPSQLLRRQVDGIGVSGDRMRSVVRFTRWVTGKGGLRAGSAKVIVRGRRRSLGPCR